eukprot:9131214-Alexandrium_andersonii.AAC.1
MARHRRTSEPPATVLGAGSATLQRPYLHYGGLRLSLLPSGREGRIGPLGEMRLQQPPRRKGNHSRPQTAG